MNKIKPWAKNHWRIILTLLITVFGTIFIEIFSILSGSTQLIEIGTISLLLLLLLSYLLLSNNAIFDTLAVIIEKRGRLITLVFAVFFGSFLVSILAIQENLNVQEQINIANRDTAPSPIITSSQVEDGVICTIANEKGLILYSSFSVEEKYYFTVNSRGNEITFSFFGEPEGNTTTLDADNKSISFFVPNYDYDYTEVSDVLREEILSQTGSDPMLSRSRELVFYFFDYQNEERTFTYSETEDSINLQTSDSLFSGPKRNITLTVFGPNETLDRIPNAVSSVLNMNPNQPSIDY